MELVYYLDISGPKPPKIDKNEYVFVQAKVGAKIWMDVDDVVKKLPPHLENSYILHYSKKDSLKFKWSIEVYGPSTIYLVCLKTNQTNDFIKNGWKKESGEVTTSCCKLNQIWKKYLTNDKSNKINLPKTELSIASKIIFIKGILELSKA